MIPRAKAGVVGVRLQDFILRFFCSPPTVILSKDFCSLGRMREFTLLEQVFEVVKTTQVLLLSNCFRLLQVKCQNRGAILNLKGHPYYHCTFVCLFVGICGMTACLLGGETNSNLKTDCPGAKG